MLAKRTYSIFLAVAILLLSLILGGCFGSTETVADSPAEPAVKVDQLAGKMWRCTMLFEREVTGENDITLEFLPEGKVKGSGGCNSYTATYTLAGTSISFGPIVSTKKSCGPSADEQEFTFFSFLSQINSLVVDDDELKLYAPDVVAPMEFTSGDGGGFLW